MTELSLNRHTTENYKQKTNILRRFCSLLIIISFFSATILLAPKPTLKKFDTPAFNGKLTLLRALSGPFHTLLADRYWLLSSSLNEANPSVARKADSRPFFNAMNTITTLDPGYMGALRYGSTYLASIYLKPDQAHKLIDTSLDYLKNDADLYLLKISLEVGYQALPRYDLIKQWIEQIQRIEGEVPEWLGGSLLFAKQRELRRELQREDLNWLLQNATTEIEKKAIEQRLSEIES